MIGRTALSKKWCRFRVVAGLGLKVVGFSDGAHRIHVSLTLLLNRDVLAMFQISMQLHTQSSSTAGPGA